VIFLLRMESELIHLCSIQIIEDHQEVRLHGPLFRRQIFYTDCDYYAGRIFQRAIIVGVQHRRKLLPAVDLHDREADTVVMSDDTGHSAASRELHISPHDTVSVSFVAETVEEQWNGSSVTSELCRIKLEINTKCINSYSMEQSPS